MRFFPWSRSRPAEEQRQQQRTAGTEAAGNDKQQPIPFPLLPGYRRDEDLEMLIEEVQQLPAIDQYVPLARGTDPSSAAHCARSQQSTQSAVPHRSRV